MIFVIIVIMQQIILFEFNMDCKFARFYSNTLFLFYDNRMSFENDSTHIAMRVCQLLKCMKRRGKFVRLWRIDRLKMYMQRWNQF